jgi:serine protease AprX
VKRNQCQFLAWGTRFLMVWALISTASLAFAGSQKLAKDLEGKGPSDRVDVIVQFKQAPTTKHHQKLLSKGGTFKNRLGLVKGGSYSVPASALAALAADPDVAYISPDRSVASTGSAVDTNAVPDYYLLTLNAQFASGLGYDGTGIGVAVIDSGISDIPDMHGQNYRVVYSQDFTGKNSPVDEYAHGTHVAGIIGGNGKNSTGSNYLYAIRGLAPNVSLINLKVLRQERFRNR